MSSGQTKSGLKYVPKWEKWLFKIQDKNSDSLPLATNHTLRSLKHNYFFSWLGMFLDHSNTPAPTSATTPPRQKWSSGAIGCSSLELVVGAAPISLMCKQVPGSRNVRHTIASRRRRCRTWRRSFGTASCPPTAALTWAQSATPFFLQSGGCTLVTCWTRFTTKNSNEVTSLLLLGCFFSFMRTGRRHRRTTTTVKTGVGGGWVIEGRVES